MSLKFNVSQLEFIRGGGHSPRAKTRFAQFCARHRKFVVFVNVFSRFDVFVVVISRFVVVFGNNIVFGARDRDGNVIHRTEDHRLGSARRLG